MKTISEKRSHGATGKSTPKVDLPRTTLKRGPKPFKRVPKPAGPRTRLGN